MMDQWELAMNKDRTTRVSKFLSLVLRHEPEKIRITLDPSGWVDVETLLAALAAHRFPVTPDELREVVAGSDKQRFALSEDGLRIRANQGHSVPVELGYEAAEPPDVLYHGTAQKHIESIRKQGLTKQARHHVHMYADTAPAANVGQRHGKLVMLEVRARQMREAGMLFYRTPNGVWLTDHVPAEFLVVPEEGKR
jgi:putative RNA 2'-phosphotransferase